MSPLVRSLVISLIRAGYMLRSAPILPHIRHQIHVPIPPKPPPAWYHNHSPPTLPVEPVFVPLSPPSPKPSPSLPCDHSPFTTMPVIFPVPKALIRNCCRGTSGPSGGGRGDRGWRRRVWTREWAK